MIRGERTIEEEEEENKKQFSLRLLHWESYLVLQLPALHTPACLLVSAGSWGGPRPVRPGSLGVIGPAGPLSLLRRRSLTTPLILSS